MKYYELNNPELMKRFAKVLNESPDLAKSLTKFCEAYNQNPNLQNKLGNGLGTFMYDLSKAYAKKQITPDFIQKLNKNVDENRYNELIKNLDKIVSANPKMMKALDTFCSACEKNPGLVTVFATQTCHFVGGLVASYVRQQITHAMTAQQR